MFIYQNALEDPKIQKEMKEEQNGGYENITLIFNEHIKVCCPQVNAVYLSKKIRKICNSKSDSENGNENVPGSNTDKYLEDNESEKVHYEKIDSEHFIEQFINNEIHFNINELNQSSSNKSQEELAELKQEKEFYEVQLTLLFNGYDVAISHKYLKTFKAICKKLQIITFLKQLSDYLEIPDIHETQHEITVLRTLENFFFSLTEDNIENMLHQTLSLYYQTRPEFFCLILLNQCLIQSKSIELFVYLFEEVLRKIDEFNKEQHESEILCKMLENIIRKSLKFEGTYGPYKPESDVAHEMFPQEYFYLCQLLYSRKLISYKLFHESFINANWKTMSVKIQEDYPESRIFITKDQYITIEDFTYDFTDKNCRYKRMSKESVEQLIKENKSKFIHKINNTKDDEDNYVNWISLYLEGENPDSFAELLRNDDIETFQRYVNGSFADLEEFIEKHGTIRRSIYERKSIVNKNLTLIEFAAFYGSVKCFKYLLINECKLDKAAKYAVAGSNSEIIHICQQHKATFEGSLLLSIRYHRWEITEWLLETLNVKFNSIAVLKLCINCGNFLSMYFIIEKILSQKAGSQEFINEIVITQSMFHLKYNYGYLMTKYKVGVNITFDDNKAIFWHEHFFSYLFDYIKPKEIKNETKDQTEIKNQTETKNLNEHQNEIKNQNENKNQTEAKDQNEHQNETKDQTENKNQNETQNQTETENKNKNDTKNQTETKNQNETDKIKNEDNFEEEEEIISDADKEPHINDYDYDDEDEINETLRMMKPQTFYELAPEMIELIYILQNSFFQINSIPYRSLSPLHAAINSNDVKFYQLLNMHSDLDINFTTYEYPMPLLYTIKMRNETIFDLLYHNPRAKLNGSSSTVAFIAHQYDTENEESEGNEILLRMLNKLLQNDRFDPNVGTSFTPQGIFNAYERHEYRVLSLLSSYPRVDLNVRDLKGKSLLHLAIIDNDKIMFNILMKVSNRVDLNLQTRILVNENYNTFVSPKMDKTPLMLCVENKRWNFFTRLLDEDSVKLDILDINHETITMFLVKNSIKYGTVLLNEMFKKKKQEFLNTLNIPDSSSKTPLTVFIDNKNVQSFIKDCQEK